MIQDWKQRPQEVVQGREMVIWTWELEMEKWVLEIGFGTRLVGGFHTGGEEKRNQGVLLDVGLKSKLCSLLGAEQLSGRLKSLVLEKLNLTPKWSSLSLKLFLT